MAGAVFSGTILVFLTVVVTVKDPSKWVLSGLAQIIPAIYAGTIISGVTMVLVCWSNHKGGPIFVGAYSPMSSLLSSILGYYFLGESIFLGW
jgi:drug/metabolite transporter (DMT)-like permease